MNLGGSMSEDRTVLLEQAERIAKLEDQTRELQQQVRRLQDKAGKRKKPKPGFWQVLRGSSGELREVLDRTLLALLFFVSISVFAAVPSFQIIEYVPGGSAFWVPVWWAAVFLMCAIGAVLFVTSRD